jgi:5-methylcytosine-specific restriction protein A
MIRETLEHIAKNYLASKEEGFTSHPLANYLRHDGPAAISEALGNPLYLCKGSAGQSDWADVPWLAVYNPNITTTATEGYYVVYLFAADMARVHLCLAQGTTKVREEFGRNTRDALMRFAGVMRDRLSEAKDRFSAQAIELHGSSTLARDYEPSIALSASYECANLPSEETLRMDLHEMARLYALLFARGGRDNYADSENVDEDDAGAGDGAEKETIIERRRYRQHRKLERNPKAARLAKRIHGYICQCCGFDFEQIFGAVGAKYIEAHHLMPLSDLPDDTPVSQDPEKDFAVLCANCHRMIHRKTAPKSIKGLRALSGVSELTAALRAIGFKLV